MIAYSSCPAIKGIFVGGRPLGLTRLNRNESGAVLQYPPGSNQKIMDSVVNENNSSIRSLSPAQTARKQGVGERKKKIRD